MVRQTEPEAARGTEDEVNWRAAQDPSRGHYQSDRWRPASAVPVASCRQILIWPLVLRTPDALGETPDSVAHIVERFSNRIAAPWREIADPLFHIGSVSADDSAKEQAARYAEFVYFHDFVQSFLFGARTAEGAGERNAPFRLFRHERLSRLEIEMPLTASETPSRFLGIVERANLFLFRTGVAVFALEIRIGGAEEWSAIGQAVAEEFAGPLVLSLGNPQTSGDLRSITLADVQRLTDRLRRSYPPFWNLENPKSPRPGYVPDVVRIVMSDDKSEETDLATAGNFRDSMDRVHDRRTRGAPVSDVWRHLLPLPLHGYCGTGEPCWRHVVDERMATLTYVSLSGAANGNPKGEPADIQVVSRGDWVRLCFADDCGTDPLPYNPGFLSDFEEKYCYDRFFPHEGSADAARYMFCGYGFCAVGAGWFFDNFVSEHFRRHYFQMALLAHLESATLLGFSGRIAEAVDAYRDRGELGNALRSIFDDYLEFVQRFRFTGVSNQTQAIELFGLWRKHLRLEEMHDDIGTELDRASQYFLALEEAKQTDSASHLNIIATLAVIIGMALAILGLDVFSGDGPLKGFLELHTLGGQLRTIGAVGLIVSLLGNATARRLFGTDHVKSTTDATLRHLIWLLSGLFAVLFVVGLLLVS